MGRRACENCDGSGEVCVHRHGDGYEDEYAACPDCDGDGLLEAIVGGGVDSDASTRRVAKSLLAARSALSPESNPEGQ